MLKDKVISISDLRNNATKIINDIPETGDKYIFVHNKPKAVLVDVDWFETVSKKYNQHGIEFVTPDKEEIKVMSDYERSKKETKGKSVEAFTFLEGLK